MFKSRQFYLNHENLHINPLICDYCQKTFSSKHYLRLHIFTHIKDSTKKSYKDLEQDSNLGRLLDMFDVNQEEHNKDVEFEEVLITQDGYNDEDDAEIVYEAEVCSNETTNHFECSCRRQFASFSDLARHQYMDHSENFQMMLESMKDEISQMMSLENASQSSKESSETVAQSSIDSSDSVEDSPECSPSDELAEDDISSNVFVECFICEKELPALTYDKHLSTEHPLEDAAKAKRATNKFCCKCCTETFKTISLCISHLKKVRHQYSGTSCNLCLEDGFDNLRDLNAHRKATHLVNQKTQRKTKYTANKVRTCETCQRTFTTTKALDLHSLKHKGKKPAYCSLCGYKTTTQEAMDRHMPRHENEPESVCQHCGRSFKVISVLLFTASIHRRKFISERPQTQKTHSRCSRSSKTNT